jgi:membrane protein implicated in regulation of membrane protease activity
MADFWDSLDVYSRVMFVVGSIFTIFMLIKLFFMFVGDDGGGSIDADGDGIGDDSGFEIFGLKLLTFRAVSAFVAIGSWSIFIFNMIGMEYYLSTLIGAGIGLLAAIGVTLVFAGISSLQTSGNLNLEYAIGKDAEVYLTVPANKNGVGKVNIYMEDRYTEVDAMTESQDNLKTGTRIRVVKVIGENLVLVDKLV